MNHQTADRHPILNSMAYKRATPEELLELQKALDTDERLFTGIMQEIRAQTLAKVRFESLAETMEAAEKHMANAGEITGLRTGYGELDQMLGGLGQGQVIIIFGDTGLGKSLLAQNIALNVATDGHPVCFVGLEMVNAENTARFMLMAGESAVTLPIIYPHESTDMDMNSLDALYKAATQEGVKLMVIDHLHAMPLPPASNEAAAIDALVWTIKRTTRKYEIPTLLLAHVSYNMKGNGFPELSDLKGSSSIKQVADAALAITRDLENDPQTLKLKLAKIRSRKMVVSKSKLTLLDNAKLVTYDPTDLSGFL